MSFDVRAGLSHNVPTALQSGVHLDHKHNIFPAYFGQDLTKFLGSFWLPRF